MAGLLAYADTADSGSINLVKVLAGLAILAGCALLVGVIIGVARSRGHRQADGIMVAAVFWGIIMAGSAMYTAAAQYNWSKEYTTRVQSGYYDPRDTSDKPKLPWLAWSGLAVGYAVLLAWSLAGKAAFGEVSDS
jgi:hypothetical protein